MKINVISTAFSSLSLLDVDGEIHCIGRKWIFTPIEPPRFWIFMPNKPNPFLRFMIKNYSFKLNGSLVPTDIKYHKELENMGDCNFFKSESGMFILGHKRARNNAVETHVFSYPEMTEIGKIKPNYKIPPYKNKNLSFFTSENKVFALYAINPLIVLQVNDDLQTFQLQNEPSLNIPNVHGGTSLIPYNENELLGICHHYNTVDKARFYSIYAYTLSKSFPFKILRFSSPLIDRENVPPNLECPIWCWWMDTKKSKVIFERGLIERENKIMIGFGIQDKISAIATLNRNELENKLSSIN